MQELRVKADGIELQIQDYENEGETIIFLHFSGANLMMWQRAIPHFQEGYRLVLVDLRGHGRSDKPDTGYHVDEMARDVVGIMRRLHVEQAHIIGSSLGAEVGLSLAANAPEKVLSLVCDGALHSEFGPYGTWEGSEAEFQNHVTGQLEKMRQGPETVYPSLDALVDARRELFEKYGWWNQYLEAMERYGACEVEEGQYTKAFGRQANVQYMENYYQYRFEDYYRRVKCPLLMLAGEEGSGDEREEAALVGLCELAEQGEIARVSGWDHPYLWLLGPEPACQVILAFLERAAL